MRKFYGILMFLALFGAAFAANTAEIAAGKALVDARANCTSLNQDQLESIGEYFMELQHPGAAHDYVEAMMGGDGSVSLKNAHIQMAQVLYCGRTDTPLTYGGMMGLGAAGYGGMMGGYGTGVFNGYAGTAGAGQYGYGMMGNYGFGGAGIIYILLIVLLIGLILFVYANVWQKLKQEKMKK
ncbi:MAG TPA: hypothetical protein PLO51_01570 [Candidatus Micrarchaeota archaeon]|nr:hypothetical protein [Candidatus Micrarchaeota archaeon]